ncbi:nitrate- and nitrite sensing domain-containing protein [Pleionea sp. CnH1-48]|uniref:nitrate- and nitrite sensing domain-containing protein n=1 Tax=Pleionea sp. CnH1-48 TaxID=2954494 RepID=UPI0020984D60|nr:nitrate- and nitrite sensing domain-containing protein [Pleionea sp. CnH1-48]MCO7223018.1 nitrate- and nitrite sensing domain-containing protein [Pleionea sp. CnH1-48]
MLDDSIARKLNHIKISHAILLIVALPFAAALYFATQSANQEEQFVEQAHKLTSLVELSIKLSNLIHEQQKERGATAGFLGGSQQDFKSELNAQRKRTDLKRDELIDHLNSEDLKRHNETLKTRLESAILNLDHLKSFREQVDKRTVTITESVNFYTRLNSEKIQVIDLLTRVSPDPGITRGLIAYTSFVIAKENAGIERAIGSGAFSSRKFTEASMEHFIRVATTQDNYNNIFLSHAEQNQISYYNKMTQLPEFKEVLRLRQIAYQKGLKEELSEVSGLYWFNIMTQKINTLHKIEDYISSELIEKADTLIADSKQRKKNKLTFIGLTFIITFALTSILILSVKHSIDGIVKATVKLSEDKLDTPLPEHSDTEVGEIVNALEVFRKNAIEQQQMKIELQNHKDNLEQEVKRQTSDLTELNAELEEFAYRTSHDLKSPIISAVKLIGIAQESIESGDKEKSLTCLKLSESGLKKLETLAEDILTIAKSKRLEEEETVINLKQLIEDSQEKLSHIENYERIQWVIELSPPVHIRTKKERFSTILENLLSNAVKYQDTHKEASFIKVTSQQTETHFMLTVEDNGLGIPKNQQQNLFMMFKRFHPRVSSGSGLGLYLMKKSADALSGTIDFEDKEEGALFRLTLPITNKEKV